MKLKLLALLIILALGATPALAQGESANTITFNGFGFSWDSALADGVSVIQYAGEPLDYEAPGSPQPPRTEFGLFRQIPWDQVPVDEMGYPGNDREGKGSVIVYRLADIAPYDFSQRQVEQLQTLLAGRPDLAGYMQVDENLTAYTLPFLPVFPAGQVIRARAQYVDTGAAQGISYVTIYRQDVSPFIASEFYYTFQGISADGLSYVAATFPLTIEGFLAEYPTDFDYEAFIAGLDEYFTESIAQINAAPAESFTPRLEQLDAIIESIAFLTTGA
ncbi:MAG: hypothetical protein IT325_04855 [Anaerolineae bacterium]|nr:hypothetical protein [Anaerolineae bacterium]